MTLLISKVNTYFKSRKKGQARVKWEKQSKQFCRQIHQRMTMFLDFGLFFPRVLRTHLYFIHSLLMSSCVSTFSNIYFELDVQFYTHDILLTYSYEFAFNSRNYFSVFTVYCLSSFEFGARFC